jgi:TatD DNase family protein
MIDTHAHLILEQFDGDRDEVLKRAHEAGVAQIICVGTNLEDSAAGVELAGRHPGVFAAVGVHPSDSAAFDSAAIERLRELSRHPRVVAVGEIGLDFYRDHVPPEKQREAFQAQIALAREVQLPIIVHNRVATAEILQTLRDLGSENLSGVLHCFSGDLEDAKQALSLGFLVSFAGNLTYKKSTLPEVALEVPLERQLLESDSPFLAPLPKRGKRNEPAFVVHTAQWLAELKGVDLATVERTTTANARRLFRLPAA